MSERFTKHARNAIRIAETAAERANHQYVGTEHLLFGVLKDGSGIVTRVLEHSGVEGAEMLREAEQIIQPIPPETPQPSVPFSPFAKQVITQAIREGMLDGYVGIKHLLMALVWLDKGAADPVIKKFGLTQQLVREVTQNLTRDDE